ncbi:MULTISPECIES: hypothetical protein [Clostridium]|uniref:GerMN domain-containing protein n=1 Tax=Clostridium cadaveris TaxID=1529 RepID=A0A1I2P1Q3_9CLOT|nr:hypothetical protein [Clostridium cadaveris]MDU4952875.1 hypothetical protein [Clostridium sp.]MDM8312566.1 hypothetical protein [Clostridium cadaveris]NME65721.1 hypothetical protein [Clostridium cadaveris]NWK12253.1 hypothetical protein [Clostridium cadaveris]PWL54793.1 MAG: hypothetical protein DBY38_03150 [Clostridium cadaveris]
MKKSMLYSVLIATLILFVTGCSSQESLKEENNQVDNEIAIIKEESSKVYVENTKSKENIVNNNKVDSKDVKNANTEKIIRNITLHYVDDNTLKPINLVKISIDDSESLKDKLQLAANEISKRYFAGLPIEVKSISTTASGQIAIVNLKENPENNKMWNRDFFQGSTGGSMTCTLLKENLLQRKYEGKWIDGIQFTYEGGEIEYQHVEELQNGPFMRN